LVDPETRNTEIMSLMTIVLTCAIVVDGQLRQGRKWLLHLLGLP